MEINKIFSTKNGSALGGQGKIFKVIIILIVSLIVLLFVFKLGVLVGFKKASFSYLWGENYHRNFAGPRNGFFRDFEGREFIDSHGVFGQIIKIDGSNLIIKGRDNVEKIIIVKNNTTIMRFRDTIKLSELKVDDQVVVIGDPNDNGQIEAKLIRLVPPPLSAAPGPQLFRLPHY